jgi:serine/threonine protein kinase
MAILPLNAVIGKYRIEKRVGSGGMGEVYRATNLQTRMPVAVKVLTHTGEYDTALARFRNEAVIQYNLRHPNVAELYEYFEYQGKACIAMEFVEGRTLDEWIRETGPLQLDKALEILADICDAVSYMHSKGTIHRDIKSENIRITSQGRAKLLDFGISVSRDTPSFTTVGHAIGTPEKMAPEQHQGLRVDARSDVWALGVLFYEMVTGVQPFANSNVVGLREDIMALRYIAATKRRPGLPKAAVRMIANCLRVKPEERYSSSGTMLREVQQLRRGMASERWKGLFSNPAAMVAAGLAVLVVALFFYALSPTKRSPSRIVKSRPEAPPTQMGTPPPIVSGRGVPAEPSSPRSQAPVPTQTGQITTDPASPNVGTPPPTPERHEPTLDANAGDHKTIRVATYDGPADVMSKDGQVLGSTPYLLTGPLGKSYELILSRQGYERRKVDVQINNKNEYLFGLEKLEKSDNGKKE